MASDEENSTPLQKRRQRDGDRRDKQHRGDRRRTSDRNGDRADDRADDRTERRRSRDRRDRRRSRASASPRRRPRSRDRERYRNRDRDRDRDHDTERENRRRRSREGRSDTRHRRRYEDDHGGDDRQTTRSEPTRSEPIKQSGPLPSQEDSFAITKGEEPEKPKEKPNFGNSGLLAAASNSVAQADGSTITLKYHEPSEARKPSPRDQWRLFIFKDGDITDTIELSARSCWLIGRETAVVDLPAEHPSISKQHAVIQFRYTEKRNEFGDKVGKVKPYLIDLESANGTLLNDGKVPQSRYLELRDKDMIQFGHSAREYVIMLAPRE